MNTEMHERLVWAASVGIDLSPGDPVAAWAVREISQLRRALRETLGVYVRLANSGDAGNWDPEKEAHVIASRKVLA